MIDPRPRHLLTRFAAAVLASSLVLATAAHAADFVNLNFEQAQAPVLQPPGFAFQAWSLAAPGWSHSTGADTSSVYYGAVHLGVTQWFALTSAQSLPSLLLSGRYSFAFNSGYAASTGPGSPWVNATLSQLGTVPTAARSLQLQALGPLAVYLGDTRIALQSLGGNLYGGDISAYAGQTLDLRLVNLSTDFGHAVTVDEIVFSPLALVPEAPAGAMLGAGLATLLLRRGRGRGRLRPQRR